MFVAAQLAAEFEIARPQTPQGWAILVTAIVLVAYLLNQGVDSLVGSMRVPILRNLIFFAVVAVVIFAATNQDTWGSDPVGRVDVLPNAGPADQAPPDQPAAGGNSLSGASGESSHLDDHIRGD